MKISKGFGTNLSVLLSSILKSAYRERKKYENFLLLTQGPTVILLPCALSAYTYWYNIKLRFRYTPWSHEIQCSSDHELKGTEVTVNVFNYVMWSSFEIALIHFAGLVISGNKMARVETSVSRAVVSRIRFKGDVLSFLGKQQRIGLSTGDLSCSMGLGASVKEETRGQLTIILASEVTTALFAV